jgi:iron-sulfur cluster assembly protein
MSDTKTASPQSGATQETIHLTPSAIEEIKRLIASEPNSAGMMLRVGIAGGGCSGLSYTMAFETDKSEFDQTFDFDGLTVLVDAKSLMYLGGTTIDFSKEILSGGFKFHNPKSARSCGCGTSFSV